MPRTKFQPDNKVAYDKTPVQVKVMPGVRENLKKIPGWQDKLRKYIDRMIEEFVSDKKT